MFRYIGDPDDVVGGMVGVEKNRVTLKSEEPGNAERLLGPHRGWYSRGYLPHFDHPGILQAITYRLADSLPVTVIESMKAEVRRLPQELQLSEQRKISERWLNSGIGSCALRNPKAAECIESNWRRFGGERYDLIAWVVMPNHVHVLIRVYEGVELGRIVQSWKGYTGKIIAGIMKSRECAKLSAKGNPRNAVWMREYWDRFIRDDKHFDAEINYIHENPVKAGLVKRAEEWPWSSAREHAETE